KKTALLVPAQRDRLGKPLTELLTKQLARAEKTQQALTKALKAAKAEAAACDQALEAMDQLIAQGKKMEETGRTLNTGPRVLVEWKKIADRQKRQSTLLGEIKKQMEKDILEDLK